MFRRLVSYLLILSAPLLTPTPSARAAAGLQRLPDGYAELVRAGEALGKSRLFARAQAPDATLAMRREALAEKPVGDALALLRQALSRPTFTPPPAQNIEVSLKVNSASRNLARLLCIQQYVQLADGRTQEAIRTTALCLRLGAVVQTGTLLNALVGLAIGRLGPSELGTHLDQLSVKDSALLLQVCLDWLHRPDPLGPVLEGERRFGKRRLVELREQSLREDNPGANPEEVRRARQALEGQFAQADRQIDAFYVRLYAELRKPAWERAPVEVPESRSFGGALLTTIAPALEQLGTSYAHEEALIRVLACHAAIIRFRWEHVRLPQNLAELELAELIVDPFTGQPLQYEVLGNRRYRLASAGPRAAASDPTAVNGRRPVTIAPE